MNGYERIKEQYLALKSPGESLKRIVVFLMKQSSMKDLYMNEEKNLTDMFTYVKDLARKKAVDNVAFIEDNEVFKWIINYYSKSNEELGINNAIIKKSNNEEKPPKNENQLKLEI